jgi:O-antigen ligase
MSRRVKNKVDNRESKFQKSLFEQTLLLAIATSLTIFPFIFDSFTVSKLLILSVGLLLLFIRLIQPQNFKFLNRLPLKLVLFVGLFSGYLILAWAQSGVPFLRGAIGQFGRGNGLFYHFFALAVFILAALAFKKSSNDRMNQLITYFSWFQLVYATLQSLGLDIAKLDTKALSPVVLTFGNSNFAGAMLAVLFTYHLTYVIVVKRYKISTLVLLCLLIFTSTFPKAFQGYFIILLSIFFGLSLFIWEKFKSGRVKQIIIITWMVGLLSIILGFTGRFFLADFFSRDSFQIRIEYWKISINIIRDHLMYGVGPDRLYDVSAAYMAPGSLDLISTTRLDNAHNWYLQLAASFGIPALTLFSLILGFVFFAGVQLLQLKKPEIRIFLPSFMAFIAIFIDGLVSLEQPGIGIWLYLFGGVVVGTWLDSKTPELNPRVGPASMNVNAVSVAKRTLISLNIVALTFSSTILTSRVIQEVKLRSNIQTTLQGNASDITYRNIANAAINLKAEPEFTALALKELAVVGDRLKIDLVSKEAYDYYQNSIQAALIRADVLRALGREKESCPLRVTLLENSPWDAYQLEEYIICLAEGLSKPANITTLTKASSYIQEDTFADIPKDIDELASTKNELAKYAVRARLNFYLGKMKISYAERDYAYQLIERIRNIKSGNMPADMENQITVYTKLLKF